MTSRFAFAPSAHAASAIAVLLGMAVATACVSERTSPVVNTDDCTAPPSAAGATVVFIKQFAYMPSAVHVRAGQSVAWVNCEADGTPHTASADDASFNSGLLNRNGVFVRAFPAAGSAPYHCDLHPFMKATVIVD